MLNSFLNGECLIDYDGNELICLQIRQKCEDYDEFNSCEDLKSLEGGCLTVDSECVTINPDCSCGQIKV
jgi:hypothetical protein